MDRLTEMEAFVTIVDQGGFTDAARKLGVSKSAVSKHISALEARLGARLLNRTTRRISPTEIGLAYYDRAKTVLSSASEADEMVSAMQTSPRGELRVSAPVSFGTTHLAPATADFLTMFPDVSVNMVFDDRFVELVAEGFDMAIRIGHLADSSLRARKLAEARIFMLASPGYLDRAGVPKRPEDLAEHSLLHYSNMSNGNAWKVRLKSGEERMIRGTGRFTANNGEALMKAAEAGVGIVVIPSFIAAKALAAGTVVPVMPEIELDRLGIYAVHPPGRFAPPKVRAYIDFLAERFKGGDPGCWVA
jgi:DNA-binding transcriptional LysR family regulator